MTEQQYYERFLQLMSSPEMTATKVIINLDAAGTVGLISTLQLALRHPGLCGSTGVMMRSLCDLMIARMDKAAPGMGELLKLGDNPAHDVG